ncbi:MAG: exopolysaccharide biosynthesis polyprenyl glycosylphosphotransferase [Candidatus Uhrbacteria bacterium]|nr:exopolysaccharide biosynthesis polyprenyl glycosylphosphotransferase [Candidatus Uhrbacteria bacterium]
MKKVDLFFTAALVPLDYLTLLASAAAAYSLRFSPFLEELRPILFNLPFDEYLRVAAIIALAWIAIFALSGLYAIRPRRLAVELTRIILACSTGIAVILAVAFFSRELFDSRFIVLAVWGLSIIFIIIERILIRGIQRSLRRFGIGVKYVVMVGKTRSGNTLHDFFDNYPKLGFAVSDHISIFDDEAKRRIQKLKKAGIADIILLANPDTDRKEVNAIKTFSDIHHLSFMYSAEIFPGSAVRPIIHTLAGQPVIEVPKTPLDGWGAIYKRLFDIVISLILIILTSPIQIIVAILLLLERQGGILFGHKRIGQGEKPYKYFKFRSMIKGAHKYRFDPEFIEKYGNMREGTPLFKLEHDPRVTSLGKFMRKFSIDEIPEFYLVLLGHMSLVGPRPHLPEEVDSYKPSQKRVLTIKPGITGMAQVSGRANLEFDEEVQLDMYYIENWSPWLDLVILIKTPLVVLFNRGAY